MTKTRRTEAAPVAPQHEQGASVTVPETLAGALLVAQASISGVGKDARNTFHKYSYTSAEGMIAACRQALHGSGLVFSRIGWELSSDGQTVQSEFLLQHPASAAVMSFSVPWLVVVEKGRPVDKALAGALTTSMGYFLRDLLLLPREDEDGSMDRRNDDPKGPQPDVGFRRQQAAPQPSAVHALNRQLTQRAAPAEAPAPAASPAPAAAQAEQPDAEFTGLCAGTSYREAGGKEYLLVTLTSATGGRQLVVPTGELAGLVESAVGARVRCTFSDRGDRAGVLRSITVVEEPQGKEAADDAEVPF